MYHCPIHEDKILKKIKREKADWVMSYTYEKNELIYELSKASTVEVEKHLKQDINTVNNILSVRLRGTFVKLKVVNSDKDEITQ